MTATRTITVRAPAQLLRARFAGSLALALPRPFEIAVLREILDLDGPRLEVLAESVLAGKVPVMRRIVDALRRLGLLETREAEPGRLFPSEIGRRAVQEERIFVPQEGDWTVLAINHPALADSPCILGITQGQTTPPVDAVQAPAGSRARESGTAPPPPWLLGLETLPAPLFDSGQPARAPVTGLSRSPCYRLDRPSGGSIEIVVRGVKLEGVHWKEGMRADPRHLSFPDGDRLVSATLNAVAALGWNEGWNDESGALQVAFRALSDDERHRWTKFRISPRLAAFGPAGMGGRYQEIRVEMPLKPAGPEDCSLWAAWTCLQGIEAVASSSARNRSWEATVRKFREQGVPLDGEVPSLAALFQHLPPPSKDGTRHPAWWRLHAANDWGL